MGACVTDQYVSLLPEHADARDGGACPAGGGKGGGSRIKPPRRLRRTRIVPALRPKRRRPCEGVLLPCFPPWADKRGSSFDGSFPRGMPRALGCSGRILQGGGAPRPAIGGTENRAGNCASRTEALHRSAPSIRPRDSSRACFRFGDRGQS